jgi:lipoprotein-anchoring transpeptidase ErfK/SrfK
MESLLSCASIIELPVSDKNQCAKLRVKFAEGCLLDAVQKTAFFEPQEIITSPDKTRSVEVRIADGTVDKPQLAKKIETELTAHFDYDTMVSPYLTRKQVTMEAPTTNSVPNTTGNYASRYIEVDGSRQLLYIWESGKYKTYGISGALAEYNPVGIHSILNKSPNAWSSTANKWMPYWMAFTYDRSQKAWLGFHALVYWYPGYKKEGIQKIYEPETNIGKPRSTGCIRMTKTDAKSLYGWARVGDLVIIHD